jgi:RecA-family ATPase
MPFDSTENTEFSSDWIDWRKRAGQKAPERQYYLRLWLPVGVGCGLYGAGGIGKSMVSQQLQTSGAADREFLGIPVSEGGFRSLGVYCEDDDDELWRRQEAICDHYKIAMSALSGMRCMSRIGKDNLLCTYDSSGTIKPTDLVTKLVEDAKRFKANILFLDNAAQMYGGNELVRSQVTQFGNMLSGMAKEINGSVVMLGHPAKNLGSEYSGSTAWDAVVRVRWLFERPKEADIPEGVDPESLRILRRAKANYDRRDEVWIQWQDGVFAPFDTSIIEEAQHRKKEEENEQEFKPIREMAAGVMKIGDNPLVEVVNNIIPMTTKKESWIREKIEKSIPIAPRSIDVRIGGETYRLYRRNTGKKGSPVILIKEELD